MQVLLTRVSTGFGPADKTAWEEVQKIKVGTEVVCDIKRARNPRQHALMFAALHELFENQREPVQYPKWDKFYIAVKWGLGWYDDVPVKNGLEKDANGKTTIPVLWSLQFANMDQDRFEQCLEQVLDLAAKVLNVTKDDFRREIESRTDRTLPAYIEQGEIAP